MEECKHKWITLNWSADYCGCCGDLNAECTVCHETINEYLSFWEIKNLNLDEDKEQNDGSCKQV